jgi:hypothetical protein
MRVAPFSLRRTTVLGFSAATLGFAAPRVAAQQTRPAPSAESAEDPRPAPARRAGEGEGPFQRLIIRGATLIDGSGGPPRGPVDIIVEGNKIVDIVGVGVPKVTINQSRRPSGALKEIDATGMYVMPGLVDVHVHQGTQQKAAESEYYNKLWLMHGITAVRGVPFASYDYSIKERDRSAKNEIVAPRYFVYQRPGQGWGQGPVRTPDQARAWIQWAAQHGVDGVKLGVSMETPPVMAALLDEAKKQKLGSVAHLAQNIVGEMNADEATRLGLETGHAFLWAVREHVRAQLDPAVARRHELQRRAESVRAGRAAVVARSAARREVERVPQAL